MTDDLTGDVLSAEDREALAAALLLAMDGDFLPAAGMGCDNRGEDVPLDKARPKEVAWWAVDAIGPEVARHRTVAADAARADLVARVLALAEDVEVKGRDWHWNGASRNVWLTMADTLRALVAPDHAGPPHTVADPTCQLHQEWPTKPDPTAHCEACAPDRAETDRGGS